MKFQITIIMCAFTFVEILGLGVRLGGGLHANLSPNEYDHEYGKAGEDSEEHQPDIIKDIDNVNEGDDQYCNDDGNSEKEEHKYPYEKEHNEDKEGKEGDKDKEEEKEKPRIGTVEEGKDKDEDCDEEEKKEPEKEEEECEEDKDKEGKKGGEEVEKKEPEKENEDKDKEEKKEGGEEEEKKEPEKEEGEEDKDKEEKKKGGEEEEKKEPEKEEEGKEDKDKEENKEGEEEKKINPELEKQYTPLLYAKNYRGDLKVVIEEDTQIAIKESEEVKKIPHQSNIRYGKGDHQLLDIYGADSFPEGSEIIVHVRGIELELNKESISFAVKPFYENGVINVVPDYDNSPANLGKILTEFRELADYVFSLAEKYKCSSVYFVGHSIAGAQGVAQLLFDDYLKTVDAEKVKLFKGVVLVSGIYDLRPIVETTLYKRLELTKETVELYSPILKKDELTIARNLSIKVLIVAAEYDSPAFHYQTQEFTKFLTDYKISHEYAIIEGEDHFSEISKLYYTDYVLTQKILYLIKIDSELKDKKKYCSRVEKYCSDSEK